MGDFDACRFDFRFDSKNGLMPAKRKRIERCSQINCGKLFKCKLCSNLFSSRAQLLEHKLLHGADYNCAICGRIFATRSRLRDHVNNDHDLREETKQEHESMIGNRSITGLAPELLDNDAITATLSSSDTLRMNSPQFQYITNTNNNASKEDVENILLNTSSLFLITDDATDSISILDHDTLQPPDYSSENLIQCLSLPSFIAAADPTSTRPLSPDRKLAQSFVLQPVCLSSIKTESTSILTPDEIFDESVIRSGNISAIAAYLAQLHALQNQLAINQAAYLIENPCENANEDERYTKITVKQEVQDIENVDNRQCFPRQSNASVAEKPSSKSDKIWDYSLKSNTIGTESQTVSETAVDLSFKTGANNEITIKNELLDAPPGEMPCNKNDGLELGLNIRTDEKEEAEATIDDCNLVNNNSFGSRLCKVDESNSNMAMDKAVCGFRSTATKRAKTGLSNMVEKLWKNKLIDSINSRSSEIGNKVTVPSETAALTAQEVSKEQSFLDSSPLYSFQATSSVYCKMQFRACPVCQQLFENSKTMWDHAMAHHEYKRKHSWKRKNAVSASSVIEEKQIEQSLLDELSMTSHPKFDDKMMSSTRMDMANISSTENGLLSSAQNGAYSTRDKLFTEESQSNQHRGDHEDMKSMSCPLCSYTCHHVILLEQHLVDKHKPDAFILTNKHSQREDEYAQMLSLDEFLQDVDSKEIITACGDEIVYPADQTVADEFLSHLETNYNNSDKSIKVAPLSIINNIHCSTLNENDTKLVVAAGDDSTGRALVCKALPTDLFDSQKSTKTESTCDDHMTPNQPANVLGKLLLRRVTPAPGNDPPFYTSVMKISYDNSSQPQQQQPTTEELGKELQMLPIQREHIQDVTDNERSKEIPSTATSSDVTKFYGDTCGGVVAHVEHNIQDHVKSTHSTKMTEPRDCLSFDCHKGGYSTHTGFNAQLLRCQGEGDASLGIICPCGPSCASKHHPTGMLKNQVRRVHLAGKHKPALCLKDVCGKSTESEAAALLNNHAPMYSQGRPLVCGYKGCDKAFRELKHLKVHQMQHTDLKPLRCELCDYSCRQRNSMNWHMKSQHGLEKYVTADGRTMYS